ncbi:MAG TPA: hypothetical protein VGK55_06955 [Actinomycetes bacterium]|jgi:hypothetical protein
MTTPGVNETDPVQDEGFPRITEPDPSLPEPLDQDELPEQGDQPEPEQVEEP